MKKIFITLILIFSLSLSLVSCSFDKESLDFQKNKKYEEAISLLQYECYEDAKKAFEELGDFKDSEEYLKNFYYIPIEITEGNKNGTDRITITLDSNDLPIKIVEVENGEKEVVDIVYDKESGNITKIICTEYYKNETFVYTITFSYNKNNKLIRMIEDYGDGDTYTVEYTYGINNNLIKEVTTNPDGDKSITKYTYDTNNNLSKSVYILEDGTQNITHYTYDSKNNLTKEIVITNYGDSSQDTTVYDYSYDTNRNLIKESSTFSNGDRITIEYIYDGDNNVIKEICSGTYGVAAVIDYTYYESSSTVKITLDSDTFFVKRELVYIPFEFDNITKTFLTTLTNPILSQIIL